MFLQLALKQLEIFIQHNIGRDPEATELKKQAECYKNKQDNSFVKKYC
jgi:hypothetical protein